jgi:predicted ferric reductase
MRIFLFALGYACAVLVAPVLYLLPLGGVASILYDEYALSVALGTAAYGILCTQFLLASRPAWVVAALGLKRLLSFHGMMAVLGIAVAIAHRVFKIVVLMFSDTSVQARLGSVALLAFILASAGAAVFMANAFYSKTKPVKALRQWSAGLGLTYPRSRIFHNLTVPAGLAVLVHVLLASTSSFSANPAGMAWMILWAIVCVGSYLLYRILGRKGV